MLDKLIALDKELLVFLNGLGSPPFDGLWGVITNQLHWAPFFLLVFYLLWKKIGWKNLGIIILFLAVLILICDQTANFCKNHFQRLRPCNDPEIKGIIRVVQERGSFSFFSGHAANSMACTMFIFTIFRKYYKYGILLFLFPLIFAYSRIYLGLHFPGDILTGYLFGGTCGFLLSKGYEAFLRKYPIKVRG